MARITHSCCQGRTKLYHTTEGGALYCPRQLNDEERIAVRTTRGRLHNSSGGLEGEWTNEAGKSGHIKFAPLPTSSARQLALTAAECATWEEFKAWSYSIRSKNEGAWFRGHGCRSLPLMTSLHRFARTRLERYCSTELAQFTAHAEAVLNTHLDLNDAHDYAVVLGLARHHGLPTPMTDWTMSPYVAAFFAFSDVLETSRPPDSTHVRIFALSGKFVARMSPSTVVVPYVRPYFAAISISLVHNPRLYAQQGRFLVTNIYDLESHIHISEGFANEQHLFAADVPRGCAAEALEDLSFMGLTAATMFPGLDGVGKMIRHQMSFTNPPPPPIAVPDNEQLLEAPKQDDGPPSAQPS